MATNSWHGSRCPTGTTTTTSDANRGGHYVQSEEARSLRGLDCTRYDVRIKETGGASKRRIAWAFGGEGDHFVVEFELLEDVYAKLEKSIHRSLQSFRMLPSARVRDASAKLEKSPVEWGKLTAGERELHRKRIEVRCLASAVDNLPEGWHAREAAHFAVVSHTDAKFTKRMASAADACRKWLDQQLGDATDEYVMRGVVRICRDQTEREVYGKRGSNWDAFDPRSREIIIWQPNGGTSARVPFVRSFGAASVVGWQSDVTMFGILFDGVLEQYLWETGLRADLPAWLYQGLRAALVRARVKGSRLEFRPSQHEQTALNRVERRQASCSPCASSWSLVTSSCSRSRFGPCWCSAITTWRSACGPIRISYANCRSWCGSFWGLPSARSRPRGFSCATRVPRPVARGDWLEQLKSERKRGLDTIAQQERRARTRSHLGSLRSAFILRRVQDDVCALERQGMEVARAVVREVRQIVSGGRGNGSSARS